MALDYTKRLLNLEARKFDPEQRMSLISKSLSSRDIPENLKYLLESMQPIDANYNAKTEDAASRVKAHLQNGYNLHFNRAFRTQGSVKTRTNIRVHSDLDLLTIIDRYHFIAPELPNYDPYTASNPDEDIAELRNQSVSILRGIYDEVDATGEKSISIYNKSLKRKIDIVFCFWYNTANYESTEEEYYRGVYLYKFPAKQKELDFPFAHIANVNTKGNDTIDGSRRGIRLLKNLRADSEVEIKKLKSFQLTSIVHAIGNINLQYVPGNEINIAKTISDEIGNLIRYPDYRKGIKSPNGTETPLAKDELVPEMKLIKADLDELIEDASKEVLNSPVVKKALLSY
jgi:hypothetical protein